LNLYPVETLPEFQKLLADEGLSAESLDYKDPAQQAKLRRVLQAHVESYHRNFEQDRKTTYGDRMTYTRLETRDLTMGELPAVSYGFVTHMPAGTLFERWLSYAAFDGDVFYIAVAHYHPDTIFSFTSDADLQTFAPHLTAIIEGLRLPVPVLQTDVKEITALAEVPVFPVLGGNANPTGQLAQGQRAVVTGQSPNGESWRIECLENKEGNCWVPADPKQSQPSNP
jgi:hypothetical protein